MDGEDSDKKKHRHLFERNIDTQNVMYDSEYDDENNSDDSEEDDSDDQFEKNQFN